MKNINVKFFLVVFTPNQNLHVHLGMIISNHHNPDFVNLVQVNMIDTSLNI